MRAPIVPPGTGYDGILELYGVKLDRNLTEAQKAAVREFRTWMEGTFDAAHGGYQKGTWAREAGARAAAFAEGTAASRAKLYAELQRQIIQVTGGAGSSWKAMAEQGVDGSYIFRGNPMPPGGGAQRVFVIAADGSCHAGTVAALEGRGAGKTVHFDKLTRIGVKAPTGGGTGGGGGGAPTPKVEPSVPAGEPEVAPRGGTPEVVPRSPALPEGWARGLKLGGNILVMVVMYWLAKHNAELAQKHLEALIETKLDPAVGQALIDKAATLDRLTAKDPTHQLYANVSADIDSEWTDSGIGHNETTHQFNDVRFVDMKFSREKLSDRREINRAEFTPFFTDTTTVMATERITYSFLLFDPEYEADMAKRAKSWEEFTAKNPRWRLKPITGEAANRLHQLKWVGAVGELQQWRVDQQLREWRKVMDAAREQARERRSRVQLIH
jgi:hypothetical protein